MRDPDYAEVIGKGGLRGYILGPSETQENAVDIALDDGREISVPVALLNRQADGAFRIDQELTEQEVVPVVAEELKVGTRKRETGSVRVGKTVTERQETVSMPLTSERAQVRRVIIDKPVSETPPVRREGDTIIFPVVEEVAVVHKQLVLKEELHVSRRRTTEQHEEVVTLREEHPEVQRTDESGRSTRVTDPEPQQEQSRVVRSVPRSILDPTKPRPSVLGPNPKSRPVRTNRILRGDKMG